MHVIRKRLRFVMVELQENATSTSVGIHVSVPAPASGAIFDREALMLLDSPKSAIFSVKG